MRLIQRIAAIGSLFLLVGVVSAEDIFGELTDQTPTKTHNIKMETGKVYQIDLISKAFDTFLRVKDATGKEVAKDDDSGDILNARLVFAPPASGGYGVVADSFDGKGRGGYLLAVKSLPEITLGQMVKGKITDKSSVKNKVTYETYVIKLVSPKKYQIDQKSKEIDSIVGLRKVGDLDNEASDDDSGGGFDAKLIFTPKHNGWYEVRCGSLGNKSGEFTVSIVEK